MLPTGRRHGHDKEPGAVLGAKICVCEVESDGRSQGGAEKATELQPRHLLWGTRSKAPVSHQGQETCRWLLLSLATVPRNGVELPS